jgi:hypothetical protein
MGPLHAEMIEEIKSMAVSSSDIPRRFNRDVRVGTAPSLRACKRESEKLYILVEAAVGVKE